MNKTLWIGIGLLVAVVLIAGYLLYGGKKGYQAPKAVVPQASSAPSGATKQINVQGKEYGFTPSKITVNKGDNVVITFKNAGTFSHNLSIPDLNLATNTIAPGQSDTLTFSASQTGTFAFYCTVDGHKDLGMQGTLEVK